MGVSTAAPIATASGTPGSRSSASKWLASSIACRPAPRTTVALIASAARPDTAPRRHARAIVIALRTKRASPATAASSTASVTMIAPATASTVDAQPTQEAVLTSLSRCIRPDRPSSIRSRNTLGSSHQRSRSWGNTCQTRKPSWEGSPCRHDREARRSGLRHCRPPRHRSCTPSRISSNCTRSPRRSSALNLRRRTADSRSPQRIRTETRGSPDMAEVDSCTPGSNSARRSRWCSRPPMNTGRRDLAASPGWYKPSSLPPRPSSPEGTPPTTVRERPPVRTLAQAPGSAM
jgi:hypothetical protein